MAEHQDCCELLLTMNDFSESHLTAVSLSAIPLTDTGSDSIANNVTRLTDEFFSARFARYIKQNCKVLLQ
jgi:hypothetical protein